MYVCPSIVISNLQLDQSLDQWTACLVTAVGDMVHACIHTLLVVGGWCQSLATHNNAEAVYVSKTSTQFKFETLNFNSRKKQSSFGN
jgi:hypothetical protein